jgi:hypothetical protein
LPAVVIPEAATVIVCELALDAPSITGSPIDLLLYVNAAVILTFTGILLSSANAGIDDV